MRNVIKIVLAAFAIAVGILRKPELPKQPLPFSHRLHVAQGLKCEGCHVNPDPGEQMTFPATAKCDDLSRRDRHGQNRDQGTRKISSGQSRRSLGADLSTSRLGLVQSPRAFGSGREMIAVTARSPNTRRALERSPHDGELHELPPRNQRQQRMQLLPSGALNPWHGKTHSQIGAGWFDRRRHSGFAHATPPRMRSPRGRHRLLLSIDRSGATRRRRRIPQLLDAAQQQGFAGVNITHPCKTIRHSAAGRTV